MKKKSSLKKIVELNENMTACFNFSLYLKISIYHVYHIFVVINKFDLFHFSHA